jgi:hypothetical protein
MEAKKTAAAVTEILQLLNELDPEECKRALQTAVTFFAQSSGSSLPSLDRLDLSQTSPVPFSGRADISPKEFLLQKAPRTDVQRVACLAFYLAQYRNLAHFKTSDLSALNTEAAQQRFSNIATAASNAVQSGYLVSAGKDKRQLSAHGEQFVLALPDQAAASLVMAQRGGRGRARSSISANGRKRVDSLQADATA